MIESRRRLAVVCATAIVATGAVALAAPPPLARFIDAASTDDKIARAALAAIGADWKDSYAPIIVDLARFMRPVRRAAEETLEPLVAPDDERGGSAVQRRSIDLPDPVDPSSVVRRRLLTFLARQTKQSFGDDLNRWRQWMWALPYEPHPEYATFKGVVYGRIDPQMRAFFPPDVRATIRLDEIDWGGVTVNGIPPLRYPSVLTAADADYLKDSHVVFGVEMNGEARAYPKRILAWHEMAIDRVGGVELTIVYCTLCGTVIPFESRVGDRHFRFGTSGLLYRSNKLMFDEDTRSLWSTFEGVPVVGELVGKNIALTPYPVVTTTWGEWRAVHPETTVLSLETGHKRDYSEGAAYRRYFATDRLMFEVSRSDKRLRNKAEVLVMRIASRTDPAARMPIAIDVEFLRKRTVYSFVAGDRPLLVLTTARGANRVYDTGVRFPNQPVAATVIDESGRTWRVTEAALVLAGDASIRAPRIAAQRAFWFGWYAQFPETRLISE
jgi:hypothetical protein